MNYNDIKEIRGTQLFKSTNRVWNDCKLNHTFRIGNLMYLYKKSKCNNPKDFELWYFKDGIRRIEYIKNLSKSKQECLLSFKNNNKLLSEKEIDINKFQGRTVEEINSLINEFQKSLKKENIIIDFETVKKFVYLRIFYETHLGTMREVNTINKLKLTFPNLLFKRTSPKFDIKYCVDVEIYQNNKLLCGLQIKSIKYKNSNLGILEKTKRYNQRKNENYKRKTGCPLLYVYSKEDGTIEDVKELSKEIKKITL